MANLYYMTRSMLNTLLILKLAINDTSSSIYSMLHFALHIILLFLYIENLIRTDFEHNIQKNCEILYSVNRITGILEESVHIICDRIYVDFIYFRLLYIFHTYTMYIFPFISVQKLILFEKGFDVNFGSHFHGYRLIMNGWIIRIIN